jgi:hypothetical protein
MWWNGPDFFTKDQSEWPKSAEIKISDDPETKKNLAETSFKDLFLTSAAINAALTKSLQINFKLVNSISQRFEMWSKVIMMWSYIPRFGSKGHAKFKKQQRIFAEEWKMTQEFLWSVMQCHNFKKDFQRLMEGKKVPENSKLSCYNPELDFDNFVIKSNAQV